MSKKLKVPPMIKISKGYTLYRLNEENFIVPKDAENQWKKYVGKFDELEKAGLIKEKEFVGNKRYWGKIYEVQKEIYEPKDEIEFVAFPLRFVDKLERKNKEYQ